jgi:flagellar hook-basal body complex protein FliE
MTPIDGATIPLVQPSPIDGGAAAPSVERAGAGAAFGEVLEGVVAQANTRLNAAQAAGEAFAAGQRDDIHGTMLALSEADITLRFAGNVRNKIIDAFYELWRMQI